MNLISFSVGSSLTIAFVLICFARSAEDWQLFFVIIIIYILEEKSKQIVHLVFETELLQHFGFCFSIFLYFFFAEDFTFF